MTYAIFKHRMLYLSIVLKQSLVYSLLIAAASITYLIIVILFEKILQGFLGYRSIAVSIFAAFLLGILFVPLRNRIQSIIDKKFFKGSQFDILRENQQLRKEVAQTERFKAAAALANSVAHEIKNPLASVQTFLEYFLQKKDDPAFLKKFNKIVPYEIKRINNLVQQLLEFAKPAPLEIKKVRVKELLENCLDLLSGPLHQNNISVKKIFSSNPIINADHNKLKQAFINLFLNAIEAMPNGGILGVEIFCQSDQLKIIITDTGCGITAKDLLHIFEPFYTTKPKGTGLGLAIVQGIIEEHGGKISVKSEIGKGTTFNIELPSINHD